MHSLFVKGEIIAMKRKKYLIAKSIRLVKYSDSKLRIEGTCTHPALNRDRTFHGSAICK
jgi:hypothetical protein